MGKKIISFTANGNPVEAVDVLIFLVQITPLFACICTSRVRLIFRTISFPFLGPFPSTEYISLFPFSLTSPDDAIRCGSARSNSSLVANKSCLMTFLGVAPEDTSLYGPFS